MGLWHMVLPCLTLFGTWELEQCEGIVQMPFATCLENFKSLLFIRERGNEISIQMVQLVFKLVVIPVWETTVLSALFYSLILARTMFNLPAVILSLVGKCFSESVVIESVCTAEPITFESEPNPLLQCTALLNYKIDL
jgi:hypothetical protein